MHARDPADLYRDRIEVSLDGRQIFYLFFGGAVIVGLVFVLGVMVGRRIEARGHVDPVRAAAAADPLAALDRLEGPGGGLSFKGTLTGAQAPTEVERKIEELAEKKPEPRPEAKKAEPKPEPRPEAKKAEPKAEPKPEPKKAEPKPEARAEKAELRPEKAEAKPEPKADRAERPKVADKAERAEPKDSRDAKDGKKKKRSDGESADSGRTRYTLQLSSFQDRAEAEAFLGSLRAAGFQAYVTEVDVGGKGTFYRVRHGAYRSAEAASDAKAELERVTRKTATVMKL